jgi:uncharacterized membrane protein YphA (DoxX/SURF4 family)
MTANPAHIMTRKILTATRLVVGLLFIFSGVVKANDPAGLGYKMQEFFEVWGWHGLDDLALPLSLAMIAFEIVAGAAVIIGWRFPLFAWMLLSLIVFFTFLTGYAVLSGKVRECGCFGDCIPLTAEQSFAKDLVLLALILLLFVRRRDVTALMADRAAILALSATAVLSLAIQAYVLRHLPVVDCLPYRKGNDILRMMQMPEGAVPDSFEIRFVYLKAGAEVEFDADHFPADFNDTAYTFVRRYDKLVRKGNAVPPISDFVIIAPSGEDTTRALLAQPGRKLIVFSRELPKEPAGWTWADALRNILQTANADAIPIVWVSSDADNLVSALRNVGLDGIPVMKGDVVAIKTAARVDPTLYLLDGSTILGKWSQADFRQLGERLREMAKPVRR